MRSEKSEAATNVATATAQAAASNRPRRDVPQSSGGTRRQRRAQQQAATAAAQRRAGSSSRGFALPSWFSTAATYGLMLGLILGILAFDFTNNIPRYLNPGEVFLRALVELPPGGSRPTAEPSFGVLAMFLITLIVGVTIILAELKRNDPSAGSGLKTNEQAIAAGALVSSIALLLWVGFGTFIAGRLVDFITTQQNTVGGILSIADQLAAFPAYVYLLIALVMIGSAFLLRDEIPIKPTKGVSAAGLTTLLVGVIFTPIVIAYSNLQPIAADIVYKQANPWDQSGPRELIQGTGIQGWDLAIEHYRKAIDLARNEDFYYLWLGRSLLEKAKSASGQPTTRVIPDDAPFTKVVDTSTGNWDRSSPDALPSATLSREDLLAAARIILQEARMINPYNTDHSANLARFYQQAADITTDPELKRQRNENSSKEYATATSLSPNNAQLWNEWARLQMYNLGDLEEAKEKLDRSLALDKKFSQTYLLRAAWYLEKAKSLDPQTNQAEQRDALESARSELNQALVVDPNALQAYQELTRIGLQLGDVQGAISATQSLLAKSPNDWNLIRGLAEVYSTSGQITYALQLAQQALALAPAEQQPALQSFVQQLSAPR